MLHPWVNEDANTMSVKVKIKKNNFFFYFFFTFSLIPLLLMRNNEPYQNDT